MKVPQPIAVIKRTYYPVPVPVARPVPHKVYVPAPYPVEKKVPYEVKVPVPAPYPVQKEVPVPVKVVVRVPQPVPVEKARRNSRYRSLRNVTSQLASTKATLSLDLAWETAFKELKNISFHFYEKKNKVTVLYNMNYSKL